MSRKALVVLAHPGGRSLSHVFAQDAQEVLRASGIATELLDLCSDGFSPALTRSERESYYSQIPEIPPHCEKLVDASILVLVFPTWWFGMPAVMKGWIDRVFAPGIAFDHANDFGPIKPRLVNLRQVVIVTTLGSPWWVDWLVMFRPVRRILKRAVFGLCAPQAEFKMLSFYAAENPGAQRIKNFSALVRKACARLSAN